MPFKMRGFSPFTKAIRRDDEVDEKEVNSTISNEEAKKIMIEDISPVMEEGGKKFVHTLTEGEYYDPTEENSIGDFEGPEIKRDTVVVSDNFPKGHLIDETQWETGDAMNPQAEVPPHQKPSGPIEPMYNQDGDCMNCDEID
tara:strand:+ start:64 stop:489 length:426 start_codon:yes stop_codon:yes gene_type:complete